MSDAKNQDERHEMNDEEPQLYALTRDAGGYKLSRRGFLGGVGLAGAAAGAAQDQQGTKQEARVGVRPMGNRILLKDLTTATSVRAHQTQIGALAFSPDGKFLASGSLDQTVKLWSMPEGNLSAALMGHKGMVTTVSFSPDGTLLATGSYDGWVNLWPIPEGRSRKTLRHADQVTMVAFHAKGGLLASGAWDKTVKLWSVPEGKLQQSLKGHEGKIRAVAFSPDGALLASGGEDKTIRLWSMPKGLPHKVLDKSDGEVAAVAFSPDGTILASGSWDKLVRLWAMPQGTLSRTLAGHEDGVWAIAFSPSGKLLASGGRDKVIRLWSIPDGRLQAALEGHHASVVATAFSPDGKLLASADSAGVLILWEMEGEKKRWMLFDPDMVQEQVKLRSFWQRRPLRPDDAPRGETSCTCDMVWLQASGDLPKEGTCVCDLITVGALKGGGEGDRKTVPVWDGPVCLCNEVCTCHLICTCNTISTPVAKGSGTRRPTLLPRTVTPSVPSGFFWFPTWYVRPNIMPWTYCTCDQVHYWHPT